MFKRILIIISLFIIGIVGGIFADQILWPYFVERPLFYQYNLEPQPIYVTEQKQIYIQENTALTEAIEKVKNAVVGVIAKTKTGKILQGSGLVVTSDGLIVTLAELVPVGSEFNFYVNNQPASYQILKRDLQTNLALIKLSDINNFSSLSFAQLEDLKIGERVFLVGNLCENKKCSYWVNEGIIKFFDETYLYTNIKEKPKLVGSSLFNIKGEVLGINIIDTDGNIIVIPTFKIRNFIGL